MTLSKVFSKVEGARKEVAEICLRLIQFNTAHPVGRTDECVAYIKEYFDRHEIRNEIYSKDPLKPNLVAIVPGKSKRKILWIGHLDVVPEGKPEMWAYPPYSGKITDDGLIYGRGASDMKGSCAAAMIATCVLSDFKQLENTVEFWFTADEEIGGGDGAKWLSETKHFKGDVCVIGDGNGGGSDFPGIDLGCKGSLETHLVAHGRTAHGSTPYLGDNAITKLIKAIPWVEKIGNFKLDLPPELENHIKNSIKFMFKTQMFEDMQRKAVKRVFYYPSVSCNIISGGVKRNMVPDYAEAVFDIRLTPGSKPLKVKEKIEELVKESAISGVEVSIRDVRHEVSPEATAGYYESSDTPFAHQFAKAIQKVTGHKPIFKILTGGTDAISVKRYTGIPCLGYGNSMMGQAHQPNEYNSIDNLILGIKVYSVFPLIYKG